MPVLEVTCITRSDSGANGRVTGIGGEGFYHPVDEAVRAIDDRTHQYWAKLDGESVWVEVAHDANGAAFLKTQKDESSASALLALEECESLPEEASSAEEAVAALVGIGDAQHSIANHAERLALRTIVRMLVLNRYGRDEARLTRNREDAIARVCGAVENMDLDEDAKEQLQEAVTRELNFFFAPGPKPQS